MKKNILFTGFFIQLIEIAANSGNVGFLLSPIMHCRKPTQLTLMVGFETFVGDYGTVLRVLKEDSHLSGYSDVLYDLKVEDFDDSSWQEIKVPLPDGNYRLIIEGYVHVTSASELVIDYIRFPIDCDLGKETQNANRQSERTGEYEYIRSSGIRSMYPR